MKILSVSVSYLMLFILCCSSSLQCDEVILNRPKSVLIKKECRYSWLNICLPLLLVCDNGEEAKEEANWRWALKREGLTREFYGMEILNKELMCHNVEPH